MGRSNLVVSMLVEFVGSSRRIVVVLDILLGVDRLLGAGLVVEGGMLLTLLRLLRRLVLRGVLESLVELVGSVVVLVVLALLMLPFLASVVLLIVLRLIQRFLFLLGLESR